jgi:hypothetical protein
LNLEFKEKTFEKQFGHELARLTNITFSPDQVDEALLGFDEAFAMPIEWFLMCGPFLRRSRRTRLSGITIDSFNKLGARAAEHMPEFKFNLFVQFKRPTFLKTRGAKQWSDWSRSYFRYETTAHQQKALERIDHQSCGRAATVYASPAFAKATELWAHIANEAVVANTNMANVGKLAGHDHYSYIEPGFFGKGHSETVDIQSEPLQQLIQSGLERNEPLRLNVHLKKTAATIVEATANDDLVTPVFQNVLTSLGLSNLDPNSLYDAWQIINAFSEAFEVKCIAIG